MTPGSSVRRERQDDEHSDPSYLVSMKHLLLGKAFEKLENKEMAAEHLQTALLQNPMNFEALDLLLSHKLLEASKCKF